MINVSRHRFAVLFVVAVLVSSGCTLFDGETTGHSRIGDTDLHRTGPLSENPPYKPIDQVLFSLDGTTIEGSALENVHICFYNRSGGVIAAENLGTFRTPSTAANVTAESDEVPHYIYVHHPELVNIEDFGHETQIYQPDRQGYRPGHLGALPFNITDMTDTGCTPPRNGG